MIIYTIIGAAVGLALSFYQEGLIKKWLPEEYEDSGTRKTKFKVFSTLAGGALWSAAYLIFYGVDPVYSLICMLAASSLLCIFTVDLHHQVIFDRFQIAFALCSIAAAVNDELKGGIYIGLKARLIGLAFAAVLFVGVAYFGSKAFGKEAMGMGDIKLALSAGLFLGWQSFLLSMLVATVFGSIILLVIRKLRGEDKMAEYPFAPFIVSGIWVSMFFGSTIIAGYLSLFIH